MRRFWLLAVGLVLATGVVGNWSVVSAAQVGSGAQDPVAITGLDGSEVARITVDEVVDPFETYHPSYPPERGYRMVLVTMTIENTGSQPFSFNPSAVSPVDDAGYLVEGVFAEIDPNTGITLVEAQDIGAVSEVSGSLAFQVALGATVNQILYMPDSDRVARLATLVETPTPVGSTVSVVANDGTESAQETVTEVKNPFEGFDPSSSPERGNHFVLVTVTIEVTGARPMQLDPNAFELLDADGFLVGPSFVNRGEDPPPDLEYIDAVGSGEIVTGVVAFEVLSGIDITSVLYLPSSERFIEVASLTGAATVADPGESTPVAAVSGDECAGVEVWDEETADRFGVAGTIMGTIQPLEEKTEADAPLIRQAAEDIAALATEQESAPVPPAGEEFNALVVAYFTGFSQGLDFFAEGLETGDPATQVVAMANLAEVEQSFAAGGDAQTAFAALQATCSGS